MERKAAERSPSFLGGTDGSRKSPRHSPCSGCWRTQRSSEQQFLLAPGESQRASSGQKPSTNQPACDSLREETPLSALHLRSGGSASQRLTDPSIPRDQ